MKRWQYGNMTGGVVKEGILLSKVPKIITE
jgi:hypothetical protein